MRRALLVGRQCARHSSRTTLAGIDLSSYHVHATMPSRGQACGISHDAPCPDHLLSVLGPLRHRARTRKRPVWTFQSAPSLLFVALRRRSGDSQARHMAARLPCCQLTCSSGVTCPLSHDVGGCAVHATVCFPTTSVAALYIRDSPVPFYQATQSCPPVLKRRARQMQQKLHGTEASWSLACFFGEKSTGSVSHGQ